MSADRKLHFIVAINPNVQHSVLWFKGTNKEAEAAFDAVKALAKVAGELLIIDGVLWQYDHGYGRWMKQIWESVKYDEE